MNLLHYVAQQAEQTQPELLTVVEDLAVLEEASKWVLLCELNLESRHIRVRSDAYLLHITAAVTVVLV